MAIPDFVTPFWDSLLNSFYRGRLGFPWTRAHRLLKTKDVAARDRQIGVGLATSVLGLCVVTYVPVCSLRCGPGPLKGRAATGCYSTFYP